MNKRTYNNAISVLREVFACGYRDRPERDNPARSLRSAGLKKKDRLLRVYAAWAGGAVESDVEAIKRSMSLALARREPCGVTADVVRRGEREFRLLLKIWQQICH